MKLIVEDKSGDIIRLDHVWSISSFDALYARVRIYQVEEEKMGKEVRPVLKFKENYLPWTFSHMASRVYGGFLNYIGVSRKSHSAESKRADENLCFKLLCLKEMSEIEKGGIDSSAWVIQEDYYETDLPF